MCPVSVIRSGGSFHKHVACRSQVADPLKGWWLWEKELEEMAWMFRASYVNAVIS